MSGGVDSSVAAAILKNAGHEVIGCFMRLGSPGERLDELAPFDDLPQSDCQTQGPAVKLKIGHQGCCSINDAADARLVAAELGIPFYVCNFKKDFGRIIDYFADEYLQGKTPNPCVRCNDWLKFGKLHEYAIQVGAHAVASGHYAQILGGPRGGPLGSPLGGQSPQAGPSTSPSLHRGLDHSKDQSYVLFGAPRDRLSQMLFPIGHLPKTEVRALAQKWGLPVFDKPDSQEICFVPDQNYAALVERLRPGAAKPGLIQDAKGSVVGRHQGQHHFTIGQRRGVNVALGYPIYVTHKNPLSNTVTVGPKEALLVSECSAAEANWLIDTPDAEIDVLAKYRYNTPAVPASVRVLPPSLAPSPSGRPGRFAVRFAEPQHAVAPGQALVLYRDDQVLGGGWIDSAIPSAQS